MELVVSSTSTTSSDPDPQRQLLVACLAGSETSKAISTRVEVMRRARETPRTALEQVNR
jgi:hypothetical protein